MPENPLADRCLTIPEAAAHLHVSRAMIYALVNQKKLRLIHIGKCSRIMASELARFLTAAQKEAA